MGLAPRSARSLRAAGHIGRGRRADAAAAILLAHLTGPCARLHPCTAGRRVTATTTRSLSTALSGCCRRMQRCSRGVLPAAGGWEGQETMNYNSNGMATRTANNNQTRSGLAVDCGLRDAHRRRWRVRRRVTGHWQQVCAVRPHTPAWTGSAGTDQEGPRMLYGMRPIRRVSRLHACSLDADQLASVGRRGRGAHQAV